jgi:hypothetical protein
VITRNKKSITGRASNFSLFYEKFRCFVEKFRSISGLFLVHLIHTKPVYSLLICELIKKTQTLISGEKMRTEDKLNFLKFFALLYRVDMRNKKEGKRDNDLKNKRELIVVITK